MALWIARLGDEYSFHTKKPVWVRSTCDQPNAPDCCPGWKGDSEVYSVCKEEFDKIVKGAKKLKEKGSVRVTISIGGK